MTIFNLLSNPILSRIILRAAVVGALVALSASVLGVTMVLKRMSMIGDGLAHAGFGALAVATLCGAGDFEMEVSIPIVMVTALFLMFLSERGVMGGDAAVAVISTGMMTAGVLIFSFTTGYTADMCSSLFGSASILTITNKDLLMSILLAAAVLILFVLFYTKIFAVTFDETFSWSVGIHVWVYKLIVAAMIAVTVVVGMEMIGSLMISALVVFPALTAMRICRSFRGVLVTAGICSVCCFFVGFIISCELALPAGASVVSVDLCLYVIVSAVTAVRTSRRRRMFIKENEAVS